MEEILLLEDKKNKLEEIRKIKIDGVMLRSRCRYEDLGEKPTKYFLNLESRNYQDKVINHLIDENGDEVYKTKDILDTQKRYYKNLYTEKIQIDDTPIKEMIGNNENQLNDDEAQMLEGEITYEELTTALKNMKNSKSPGNDGFTTEFLKFLAHLSQRLIGELIGYSWSGVRPSSVRPSVRRKQFQTSSSPKPLGRSKPNFMWSLLG